MGEEVSSFALICYFPDEYHFVRPDEIYHVAVMPCYDKKLEASREEFFDAELGTRDVDCVITAGELWELVGHFGWDLRSCDETPSPLGSLPEAIQRPGSSSGSYCTRSWSTFKAHTHHEKQEK